MTTRDKIIGVTVAQLGQKPLEKIVIREIAREAEVNVAAVNYHFRSKEALVTEAINKMVNDNLDSWVQQNLNLENPSVNDLVKFLLELHNNTIIYRDFSRTKMHHVISSDKPDESNRKIYELILSLINKIDTNADNKKLKASVLYNSLISFSISAETASGFAGFSTAGKDVEEYIQSLIKIVFPQL